MPHIQITDFRARDGRIIFECVPPATQKYDPNKKVKYVVRDNRHPNLFIQIEKYAGKWKTWNQDDINLSEYSKQEALLKAEHAARYRELIEVEKTLARISLDIKEAVNATDKQVICNRLDITPEELEEQIEGAAYTLTLERLMKLVWAADQTVEIYLEKRDTKIF